MTNKAKSFRKIIAFALALCLFAFGGCASWSSEETSTAESASESESSTDTISVATTSVAICQILEALGYTNVVGVPETDDKDLGIYSDVATIGEPMAPDIETIVSIDPDIVISPLSLESSLAEEYNTAGISAAFIDLGSLSGMYEGILSLGELLGHEEEAQAMYDEYTAYIDSYTSAAGEGPTVLILMCFADGFYLVATDESYVGNLCELAGATNVYAGYDSSGSGYVSINTEDIIEKNPDKILIYAHYSEETAFAYMQNDIETDSTWQYFDAVVNGEVYYLSSDSFGVSATLDWQDAFDALYPILYGDSSETTSE